MRLLSVVIPVKDERANVGPMVARLRTALVQIPAWEVLFIDDGSRDGTHLEVQANAAADSRIRLVRLRRNFGQSAALQAGFDLSEGDVVATLDGDLQNDPADIPAMLAKLDEGFDAVLGERTKRQDKMLFRKIPSRCANFLLRRFLSIPYRDFGCTLRVMRRDVVDGLQLYGEMHRFITAIAVQQGAYVAQVPVQHHPRTAGVSKYNITRTFRVVLDALTVKFLASYQTRPMHLFGGMGLIMMLAGFLALAATVVMKWTSGQWMTGNPLLLLSVMLEVMGVQFLSLGLIGEVLTRVYYERQGRRPYVIRESIETNSASNAGQREAA